MSVSCPGWCLSCPWHLSVFRADSCLCHVLVDVCHVLDVCVVSWLMLLMCMTPVCIQSWFMSVSCPGWCLSCSGCLCHVLVDAPHVHDDTCLCSELICVFVMSWLMSVMFWMSVSCPGWCFSCAWWHLSVFKADSCLWYVLVDVSDVPWLMSVSVIGLWQSGHGVGHENGRLCSDVWGPRGWHQLCKVLPQWRCFCHRVRWCNCEWTSFLCLSLFVCLFWL